MNRSTLVSRLRRLVRRMDRLEDLSEEGWTHEREYNLKIYRSYAIVQQRAKDIFERVKRTRRNNLFIRHLEYEDFEERCSTPLQPYDFGDY